MQDILKSYVIFYIVLMCFYVCHTKLLDKIEGSSCVTGRYNGTCLKKYKCLQTIKDLVNDVNLEICSYDGDVPIVCCTECSEFHVENVSNAIVEPVHGILFKDGRKAWDKCLDYIDNNLYPCLNQVTAALFLNWKEHRKCHTIVYNHADHLTGGRDASKGEFPHMALLGYGKDLETAQWLCGGSLISETFILTAGHCISSASLGPVEYAALGMLKRSDPLDQWERYSIKRRIPHPEYKSPKKYHDIALLETTSPVKFSQFVLPACLPVNRMDETYAKAAGWGALGHRRELADVLQKVVMKKFKDEDCSAIYTKHRNLLHGYNSTIQMCFGDYYLSRDTCEGDSGGPLFINNGCRFDVIGVTSYGRACGFRGNAGMYTRVEYYVPWIESIVWP